jgi:hypothetical protein
MVQESERYQPRTSLSEQMGGSLDEEFVSDIDATDPADYIVNVGDLEDEDEEDAGVDDDGEPPAWYTSQLRIAELREEHKRHETDTGSPNTRSLVLQNVLAT